MIKIDNMIIIFSLLIVLGLGIRANIETQLQAQASEIIKLKGEVVDGVREVEDLQEQLKPLEYASPLKSIKVSSGVGVRVSPLGGGKEAMHGGLDLSGKTGDPVYAVLAGVVVEHFLIPGWYNGKYYRGHNIMGGMITIKHEKGLYSVYGHLSASYVKEDDRIEMGQLLGLVGNTGYSTGPHLHWAFIVDGFKYLRERR